MILQPSDKNESGVPDPKQAAGKHPSSSWMVSAFLSPILSRHRVISPLPPPQ